MRPQTAEHISNYKIWNKLYRQLGIYCIYFIFTVFTVFYFILLYKYIIDTMQVTCSQKYLHFFNHLEIIMLWSEERELIRNTILKYDYDYPFMTSSLADL